MDFFLVAEFNFVYRFMEIKGWNFVLHCFTKYIIYIFIFLDGEILLGSYISLGFRVCVVIGLNSITYRNN